MNHLKGKKFFRISKITGVRVEGIADHGFIRYVDEKGFIPKVHKPDTLLRPKLKIYSTEGVSYDAEECFFLMGDLDPYDIEQIKIPEA